ncbi:conserved unknown protein [Ectocarpus siliculosus]|uniref:Cathepsin propeptide inhibitor domain-containing protein n=1 Tax=Ectocarpus siliculosus TaxID=2880 RepID=D7FLT7_ECTSI|nr:conserved unknown protein [Ectocarpus siliculosus]|eukprot:CBJ29773.1 conserved unknown protein [Ectocarpus siliculosus]
MRLHVILAALVGPSCVESFAVLCTAPSSSTSPVSTSLRCRSTRTMMTLPTAGDLNRALGAVLVGGALITGAMDVARADVSISPRCITGEGAQCEDLAEGNELIKSLQAKSAISKDRYFQETLDTYNVHNFKDYFKAESKHMVKHNTGKYEILTNAEYAAAEKAGKVRNDVFLGED